MPRYYHCGPTGLNVDSLAKAQAVDDEDYQAIKKSLTKHHPLTVPARDNLVARDGKVFLKKPGMYCQLDRDGNAIPELIPWEAGSIAFGLPGFGFYVVPPNGHVDLDVTVSEKQVRDVAPHLLSEAEYLSKKGPDEAKKSKQ